MDDLIRIAIVDDHQLMREAWKFVIQRDKRFDIIAECSGGTEAIQCAISLKPDIILMDVNMSPVNGFEATRKISKLAPSVKIIGLSNNSMPAYARNMMKLGAKGYVTKNSLSTEMVQALLDVHSGGTYICLEIKLKMDEEDESEFQKNNIYILQSK